MLDRVLAVTPHLRIPLSEFQFRTSRSGGPGGQNVNKVETRVELLFDLTRSSAIPPEKLPDLLSRLSRHLDQDGCLHIVSDATRSQWQNKQDALQRCADLLREAMRPVRRRVKTTPGRLAKVKRVDRKRRRGTVKKLRGRPSEDS